MGRMEYEAEDKDDKTPEQKLANLMNRDMTANVNPRILRLFILANWRKISCYAHKIHDDAE